MYEEIIGALPNLIFRWKKDESGGVYLTCAEGALAEEFGVTTERVAGRRPEDLSLPEFHETALPALERAFAGETVEFLIRVGGRTFQNVAKPFPADGTPPLEEVVGYVTEVTGRERADATLRKNEERFRALVQNASDVVSIIGPDGVIRYQSPSAEKVYGYRPEEMVGENGFRYLHPDDVERASRSFTGSAGRAGASSPPVELRMRHKDGTWRWVEAVATNQLDNPGVAGIVLNARDVTERRLAEERLREAEEKYRTLVEEVPAVTYAALQRPGEDSTFTYISPQIKEVLGYSQEEYTADPRFWRGLLHPDDRDQVLAEDLATGETGGPFRLQYRMRHKDGRFVWLREEGKNVRTESDGTRVWHGVLFDVTELKLLEQRLVRQALHDPLTDLPNRRLFEDRLVLALDRAGGRGAGIAVLLVDLDDFKVFNDSLGHNFGDRLLIEAAGRLRSLVRPGDTAARLGGDEFALLLEDVTGAEEAARVARRLEEALGEPFAVGGGREAFVTASVGIVSGVAARKGPGDLLRAADLAMYAAKRGGKANYAVFEEAMYGRAAERLRLRTDLRRSLERGEFVLHYQPVVLLGTGRIVGAEALLRWEHPERGLLAPGEFLPLAEETGLVVPVGRWVLREACRRAAEWHELYPSDPPLIIGINVSARQLRDPHLAEDVEGALREAGLAPEWLTLEVTESAFVEDEKRTTGILKALSDLGVGIALDDFGTGYSSLSYLKRLPAGLLKIDGSFVRRIGEDPEDEVLVSGMVSIAHGLGLGVLAEGVETPEQLARIETLGCDLAQGNLFSEPVPDGAFGGLLGGRAPR